MTIERQFSLGLRWVAAGRFGSQLISWGGTILVMRLLAPQDYGLAAICTAIMAIVSMAAEFGIGAGIVQATRLEPRQLRSVFGAALLFSLAGALVVAAAAPLLAWFFKAPEAERLIQASALQLVLAPLATMSDAHLRRELRFQTSSIIDFVSIVAATSATVLLAWRGSGVWALVLGPLIGAVVRVLLLNLLVPQRLLPSFDLRPARALIGFGFKIALSRIASYVFGQSDVLIAARTLSKTSLGEYSVAMHLAMLPVAKAMAIVNQVTYPVIAQLNRDGGSMQPLLLRGLRLFSYVVMPVLWGLAAVSPWLVPALLGPHWQGAILPLQIVALALPLRLLSVLLSSVIQGMGHAGLDLRNSITGVVVLPCCFVVGAQFGAIGLALAWLVGLPILITLNLQRSRPVLGISLGNALRALSKPLALSAAMAICVSLTGWWGAAHWSAWPTLLAAIFVGALSYLGLFWLLDRDSVHQLLRLVRPAPQVLPR
ncbi:lipopolysaccharide biosynthesis protein [Paucibacter sp. XJ19-41]|uniref:lipopolysaccharide biosynthesis protein n=1 Tax=Paucibacter sp. XJ19-41 TaxID=2927824 RepID=UPI00234BDF91|nr:lipopolysaccharide biosynthesis protein [Paucibacter sp. XJ19-41]MDC6166105.1 lipopolysaccharide biosynthesis protein [Paucibacter sp. XJ19-41]